MNNDKIWFVTGASKGIGLGLVKNLLAEGYSVAATSRNPEALVAGTSDSSNLLALKADVADERSVQGAIARTLERFKKIDVAVNNAGFGQSGTLEELTDDEIRRSFDVNVFGALSVIRHTMPHMRSQRSGDIFNISSIGGFTGGFSGFGAYIATKFAIAGLSETLAAEAGEFGVNTTLVYPGYFRTNFLSSDSFREPAAKIEAYTAARASEALHRNELDGNQPGDPEKLVRALIEISRAENPPLHLFLGEDAYQLAQEKIASVQSELETWKSTTLATGFGESTKENGPPE